jgi:hypothetical protein
LKKIRKNLLLIGLILSISFNMYLFRQLNDSKQNIRIAQFEKIQSGVNYSLNFGEILQIKYKNLSLDEKVEYLTAMSWSLQLSTHMLEIVEPSDEKYGELADLFKIYSHIASPNDLGLLMKNENVSDEEVLNSLDLWLADMKYLDESLDNNKYELSKMNSTELKQYWGSLLQNLKYENKDLIRYKKSF